MTKLIVTGDDFGLAEPINEAIEEAHRQGILTCASLMVGGQCAADAVERAYRLPSLKVGLHLVVVEGKSVLPPAAIPHLVDTRGEFSTRLMSAGIKFFFRPGIRRQLEDEIRAQFIAFQKTGLPMDHANAHNHMHLHPTILSLILKVGQDFGLRAIRLPFEPPLRSWHASGKELAGRLVSSLFLSPWIRLMRFRLRRAGLRFNDYVFGMSDSGSMTADLLLKLIEHLPPHGTTEIYFHPATRRCPEIDRTMPRYRHEEEYKTLLSMPVRDALMRAGVERIAFGDL